MATTVQIASMKTFLIAILMFAGLVAVAPDAEARNYRHGRSYYSGSSRVYYSGHRHYYPRRHYYHYHRPYYRSYYRSYYPSYYSNCGYGYYRRPGVSISFGF